MITFEFLRLIFVEYVSPIVNVFVTDIFRNITNQEHNIFTWLHISSRLFELSAKEVRVKKQPEMPLKHDKFWAIIYSRLNINLCRANIVTR